MISEIPDPMEPYRAFEKNIMPFLDGIKNMEMQAQAIMDAMNGPDSIRKLVEQSENFQSAISNLEQPLQIMKDFQGKFGAQDFQTYRKATERADSERIESSELRDEIARFTEEIIATIALAKQEIIEEINQLRDKE